MKGSSQTSNQQSTLHPPVEQSKSKARSDYKVRSVLAAWLNQLRQFFADLLTKSDEIQVRQRTDSCGQLWWYTYNPRTKQSGVFVSESEVRWWIEQQLRR